MALDLDLLTNDVDSVPLNWILEPKRAREGMFEEKDSEILRQMVAEFEETPLEVTDSLTTGRKKQIDDMWKQWQR